LFGLEGLKIATEPPNWQFQAQDITQSVIGTVLLFFTGPQEECIIQEAEVPLCV